MRSESPEIEEYLEAIYRKKEKGKSAKTKEIAMELGVSPPSVTEMFEKLAKKGLIVYEPYKGAILTKMGEEVGSRIVRKHRLLERFLNLLGINKDKVHEEACILEHAVSDEVEQAMKSVVSSSEELEKKAEGVKRLTDLVSGEEGKIAFIVGEKGATQRLVDMGLTPDTKIKVKRTSPYSGPVLLDVRSFSIMIGRELAENIFVKVEK